jgi:hypothetical protein
MSGPEPLYELVVPAHDANVPATVTESSSSFSHDIGKTNKSVRCTHIDGATITIQPDATISHPLDSEATYIARGGALTFVAGVGVTLNIPEGFLAETDARGAWVIIKKYAANAWDLTGGPLVPDPGA